MKQSALHLFNPNHMQYLEEGIKLMTSTENTGNIGAFQDNVLNQKGIFLQKKDLLELFESYHINTPLKKVPQNFTLKIKYSPISLFKKWIFYLSNHSLLKVTERNKQYAIEFFIYHHSNHYTITPLTTNVAHERFLYYLYQKEILTGYQVTFQTNLNQDREIVLYKDYILGTEHAITLKTMKNISAIKRYRLTFEVSKDEKQIVYIIKVEHQPQKSYHFLLSPNKMSFKEVKLPKRDSITSPAMTSIKTSLFQEKDMQIHLKKLSKLIQKFHNTSRLTNKFANIALGRINKIPVLINLPNNYKNTMITVKYEKNKVHIYNKKGKLIKTLVVSKEPKSNWLMKEKNKPS